MKKVFEMSAAKALSVFVILDKHNKHIATVQSHYSNGGACTVNVISKSKEDDRRVQEGRAGGYGYDKFTAALAGLTIDGHKMFDHCGIDDTSKRLLAKYLKAKKDAKATTGGLSIDEELKWVKKAQRIGATFANGRTSLYYESGLKRLEILGYKVIQGL